MKAWYKYAIDAAILILMGLGAWFVRQEGQMNGETIFFLVLVTGGLLFVNHGAFQSARGMKGEVTGKFAEMNRVDGDATPMRAPVMARRGKLNGRGLGMTTYLAYTDKRLVTQSANFAFSVRGRTQMAWPWENIRSAQILPKGDGPCAVKLKLGNGMTFSFTVERQGMEGTDFGDQTAEVRDLLAAIQRHTAPNVSPVLPWN